MASKIKLPLDDYYHVGNEIWQTPEGIINYMYATDSAFDKKAGTFIVGKKSDWFPVNDENGYKISKWK